MARFQFCPATDDCGQTTDRQTDKTDCLTPLRACARGVIIISLQVVANTMHTNIFPVCLEGDSEILNTCQSSIVDGIRCIGTLHL